MDKALIQAAKEARDRAYAPYSCFAVGAALETADGQIFVGTNVENASYGATICAERVAFGAALAAGKRTFARIAILGGRVGESHRACMPCGICRQVMREFCDDGFEILTAEGEEIFRTTLSALLPASFSAASMEETT